MTFNHQTSHHLICVDRRGMMWLDDARQVSQDVTSCHYVAIVVLVRLVSAIEGTQGH